MSDAEGSKKDKLFTLGFVITAAWLLAVGVIVAAGIGERPTKLNEWGDFFAGVFAPLAFLWVVLGLKKQANDLKESLAQQAEAVHINRLQQQQQAEAFKEERQRYRASQLPVFYVSAHFTVVSLRGHELNVTVHNYGGPATDFRATMSAYGDDGAELRVPYFKKEVGHGLKLNLPPQEIAAGKLTYTDCFGESHDLGFSVYVSDGHPTISQPKPRAASKMVFADKGPSTNP